MAAAWRFAEYGGEPPDDYKTLGYIDRFGAAAVLGRPLGLGEIRRMVATENVIKWHAERARSENWQAWAKTNPEKQHALITAMKAAEAEDNGG